MQKGQVQFIVFGIAVLAIVVAGAFYLGRQTSSKPTQPQNQAVTVPATPSSALTLETPEAIPIGFISSVEAVKALSSLPEGFLYDKSLKGKVRFFPEIQPTVKKPYWVFRISQYSISEKGLEISGYRSWAYVDAKNGKFICAWEENGRPNNYCIEGSRIGQFAK